MNTQTCSKIALALLTAFLSLAQALPAHADAAPPRRPPGASINPGEGFVTHVQMVSQEVLLVVDAIEPTNDRKLGDGGRGTVEASFVMRNQGESAESFDVWFPLGASSIYDDQQIENFNVWVDGVPVPASRQLKTDPLAENKTIPWATWPTTFPPGQDVILYVTYDVVSTLWEPFFIYHYILETGAGWWGPIGAGNITFRLPFEPNSSNTVFQLDQPDVCISPGNYRISGTDVIWSFSELEPTPADNVCLTMLRPALWQGITAARDQAAAKPNSADAHLRLARLQAAALPTMPGIVGAVMHIGDSIEMADLALAAYEQTLVLDPTNTDIHAEYLELLAMVFKADYETWRHADRLHSALEQALQLAPDDQRLLSIAERIQQMESLQKSSPAPIAPTVTFTPSPLPTATFTPSPTLPNVTPSTTPQTSASKPWPAIILALVLAPLVALAAYRARRK